MKTRKFCISLLFIIFSLSAKAQMNYPSTPDPILTKKQQEAYIGQYQLTAGERTLHFKVYKEKGKLMAQADGQQAGQLQYKGDGLFEFVHRPDIKLKFTLTDNKADKVMLYQNGMEIPGKRIQ